VIAGHAMIWQQCLPIEAIGTPHTALHGVRPYLSTAFADATTGLLTASTAHAPVWLGPSQVGGQYGAQRRATSVVSVLQQCAFRATVAHE
jgi:hypothetical protein